MRTRRLDAEREARSPADLRRTALLLACATLLACSALLDRADVEPHRWWDRRGPVVPHDTFPADCTLCHVGDDWQTIRDDFEFDHMSATGVQLEGAHATAECLRCHNDRGPVEVFARRGCAGCHEDVHKTLLGRDCASCHGQVDWLPRGQIAKHAETRFPLIGAHVAVACFRCHPGANAGIFSGVDIQCVSCHQGDLATALNPNHQQQGWVDACDRCHIPTTWSGAGFNHATFPLTGAHKSQAQCSDCHLNGVFAGTPTQCVGCHLADYNGATSLNHVALNVSTSCELCHGTVTWSGANFNHVGITAACVTCHLADYNATTSPNHVASGFPQSCEDCHQTTSWFGAVFQHSFPINAGDHAGLNCTDCHVTPGNFMTFSCIQCHEHNQADMDDKHDDVPGYVYQSSACFLCHPDGQE